MARTTKKETTEDALLLAKESEQDTKESVNKLTDAVNVFTSSALSQAEVAKKLKQVDASFNLAGGVLTEGVNLPVEVEALPADKVEKALEKIDLVEHPEKVDKFVHARNEDGSVNWRKMVNPEWVVLNLTEKKEEIERVYGKPVGELDIEKVDDKYKLILLQGIKELADLRGFKSVKYPVVTAQPGFVSAFCEIEWLPFENQGATVYTDAADATPDNTFSFTKEFLTAMAVNRAFVRSVKNFLKINLLGKDEIGEKKKDADKAKTEVGALGALQAKLEKMGRDFNYFKNWWVELGHPEAENWTRLSDIPSSEVWTILKVMAELEKERAAKKQS